MRGRIEIVSASAGSGKTTRLARELEDAVLRRGISPEHIVATTFTRKAAAELIERGRQALLRAGRPEEAELFRAARIGTVNAVAGMIVSDFAFEAGVSPDLIVLDEARAEEAFRRSLGEIVTDDDLAELARLGGRFHELPWQSLVRDIASAARTNHIDGSALGAPCEASVQGFLGLLDPPAEAGEDLDARLEAALTRAVHALRERTESGADTTKKTREALDLYEKTLHRFTAQGSPAWPEWAALAGQSAAVKSDPDCEPVRQAASALLRHPHLRADCEQAIRLCFGLARRALEAYQRFKRDRRAIDFVDQETLAFELLQRRDVQDALSSEVSLVLVDELQDVSPLQLALFLSLARVAPRSVWVGDQKQAIYGFRGADPSLMEAVVGELLGGREPETLAVGRRSRAPLVRLTNALFVPPFREAGLPASRVALEPVREDDPAELGAPVERWQLSGRTKADEAAALAEHVRHLLDDASVRVRDRDDGSPRRLRPRDVAVLCRRREACLAVAARLAELDVGSEVARAGLLATLEGRAVLAGLRLWVDGDDRVARAEIGRLEGLDEPPMRAVPTDGDEPSGGEGATRVLAARAAAPFAGALEAFDAVARALRLDELVARRGRGRQGTANIDALRAHAVSFVRLARHRGGAASPAALAAHLEALAADGDDAQALAAGEDAITVTTWHAAKGLEWPIVVLYELDGAFTRTALGVHVDDTREAALRLDAPLEGRTIRCWPTPFHPRASRTPFHERLERHEVARAAAESARREELRLLYVGWTRARDRLVLASRGDLADGTLALLASGGAHTLAEPAAPEGTGVTETRARWGGYDILVAVRRPPPRQAAARGPTFAEVFAQPERGTYAPARLRPSDADERGAASDPLRIGPALAVDTTNIDPSALGSAVHGFFAADVPGLDDDDRAELATRLLSSWDVLTAIDPASLLDMSARLWAWLERRWPGARVRREWPIEHRRAGGTVVRGIADLVVETGTATVVLDHKVLALDEPAALNEAAGYAGQLRVYAEALVAAGAPPGVETWIHLPLSGLVVRVS